MSQLLMGDASLDDVQEMITGGHMLIDIKPEPPRDQHPERRYLAVMVHRDDHLADNARGVLLEFLNSVNPQALESAMIEGGELSTPLGVSALNCLKNLALAYGT